MIPLFKVFMPDTAPESVKQVLMSGYIGQGQVVNKFEEEIENILGIKNPLTTGSGTAALQLALRLIGVGPQSEVISTAQTCTATNFPILATGAKIVWADINPNTINMSIESIVNCVTPKTDAIMVVHWGGCPVDVFELKKRLPRPIPIIEDCAHALGAKYNNIPVGNSENYCAFSFQAIKHLTTVDGGMLTVPEGQYNRAKLLRWYGIDREDKNKGDFRCELPIDEWGWKWHMNDVCAAVGIEQLKHIWNIVGKHQNNAHFYNQELQGVDGVELLDIPANIEGSYWIYTIKVERRADFMKMMKSKNIITSRVHQRNDIHPCLAASKKHLPNLDSVDKKIVCIPVGWWVLKQDREYIEDCIKGGW